MFFSAVEQAGGTQRSRNEYVPFSRSTAKQNKLDYEYSTRNRKFKRLEPHFQTSATRSAPKEDPEKCCRLGTPTKVHEGVRIRSAKFWPARGGRGLSRKTKSPRKKNGGRRASFVYVVGAFFVFCGLCNTGETWQV